MNWEERRLDELGFVGRGKSRHRPRNDPSLYGGEYPFIQTADIASAPFRISGFSQTYNEKGLAQSKLWTEPTLCMTIAGENTAKTAILDFPACFPDSIVGFIPDPEQSELRFVKYALDQMKRKYRAVSKGATQDNLSLAKILAFPLLVPPVEEQERIANVLGSYEDLIENNRRRISLLEDAARQLYKEWFVRFRFPGHEHVPIVDGVPDGWERKTLREVLTLNYGKALKADDRVEGDFPVYGSSGVVGFHNKALVKAPGIIVGRKGNVGAIHWSHLDYHPIDTVYFVDSADSDYFVYHALLNTRFLNTDVAVPGLNRDFAYSREINIPTDDLREAFEAEAGPIYKQVQLLQGHNVSLAKARDLLLPKLMSGEIVI